jgi:hypothetical protein
VVKAKDHSLAHHAYQLGCVALIFESAPFVESFMLMSFVEYPHCAFVRVAVRQQVAVDSLLHSVFEVVGLITPQRSGDLFEGVLASP